MNNIGNAAIDRERRGYNRRRPMTTPTYQTRPTDLPSSELRAKVGYFGLPGTEAPGSGNYRRAKQTLIRRKYPLSSQSY